MEQLPVAAATIYPGELVTEAMLRDRDFPLGTSEKYPVVTSRLELTGKVARRTLIAGKLISRNAVTDPELVSRGTVVRAVFEDGGLTMSTSMLALQSGSLNALVQVRNIDSGKVVVGTVQADGTVRVGGS